jgi:3-methyladenine DNA glycosylase AlkD
MKAAHQSAIKEIKSKLQQEAARPSVKSKLKYSLLDPKNVAFRKKYVGTTYEFVGLSVPQESLLFNKGYSFQEGLRFQDELELWTALWSKSKHYHVMSQALMALSNLVSQVKSEKEHRIFLKTLSAWLPNLDNWAHSDGLSSLLAQLLDSAHVKKPLLKEHLELRRKWNKSKNFWERRQSIVSLLYYSSLRENYLPFKTIISFVQPLLKDEAFYVQRGVGWALRESYNCYPKETLAFLRKKADVFSSIAFSASTEKLSKKDKLALMKLRRQLR